MNTTENYFSHESPDMSKRITAAADMLGEFYESVSIVVTYGEGQNTELSWAKRGNHYAVKGSLESMLRIIEDGDDEIDDIRSRE